jgi:hypothetical protein
MSAEKRRILGDVRVHGSADTGWRKVLMGDAEDRLYWLIANDGLQKMFALFDERDADELLATLSRLRDGLVMIATNNDEPYAAAAARDLLDGKDIAR